MDAKINSFGLYDAPVRTKQPEEIGITEEEIQEQLDSGAFIMSHDEAVQAGFLSKYDEQDTRILDVRGQK